jgi:hypothetical protein
MKIAILGWGSLIWNPQNLAYNIESNWSQNGPFLPIEYSRISGDGRLTLVISDDVNEVKTLFAISTFETLDQAILNLAIRENSNISTIGFYIKNSSQISPNNFKYRYNIENWLKQNDNIDAVIWTNLPKNWTSKTTYQDRIEYLLSLTGNASVKAEEYIRKTPKQINTELRNEIEKSLNWKFFENN